MVFLLLCCGNVNCYNHSEKQFVIFHKFEHSHTLAPNNYLLGIHVRESLADVYKMRIRIFTEVFFLIKSSSNP